MKRAVKEYFEDKIPQRDLSDSVLLRIKEEKIRNLRRFSLLVLTVNLLMVLFLLRQAFPGGEYQTMSAGVEVRLKRQATVGELEDFLKEGGLSISGPTPKGTFLLRGGEKELQKLPKKSPLFEVVE
ncbi:MAG: hypothetical protein RMH93_00030 [Aquificaceae bacterium]|nr:hypothetical protein [Aquificaceae bacterium]MCS7196899.1 hypothetical protein [Aquificaceae bacterium]MDW8031917.1 hypothetical protein [Aquificaceae bacterium]MDW8294825.1 hypothetical protein [Aquificaceae bacterium]